MLLGKILVWLTMAVLAVLGIGFAMLNTAPVELNYHYGAWEMPLALLVGLAIASGLFVGLVVSFFLVLRLKRQNSSLRRQAARKTEHSGSLRTVPIRSA